jgi:hypothetical protein
MTLAGASDMALTNYKVSTDTLALTGASGMTHASIILGYSALTLSGSSVMTYVSEATGTGYKNAAIAFQTAAIIQGASPWEEGNGDSVGSRSFENETGSRSFENETGSRSFGHEVRAI